MALMCHGQLSMLTELTFIITYLKELFFLTEQSLQSIYSSRMAYTMLEGWEQAGFGVNHPISSFHVISLYKV